jgi:hypothetical protein
VRIRSFRVPFSKVVPEDAHEIEFGPDDYMVVRPIFGLPANEIAELTDRMTKAETEEAAEGLIAEVLKLGIEEWHLTGLDDKPVPKPTGGDDLRALPGALASSLYPFLTSYRGEAANPTTRS